MEKREIQKPKPKKDEFEKQPLVSPIVAADSQIMPRQGREGILSDVLGSYTGTPADYTQPEQDADDL